jgi:exodeoxyribonuclease V alpha subunit
LLYTAVTRARRLAVLVGTEAAIELAVRRADAGRRITTLAERLRAGAGDARAGSHLAIAAEPPNAYDPAKS